MDNCSRHSRLSSAPRKGKEDARLLLTRLNYIGRILLRRQRRIDSLEPLQQIIEQFITLRSVFTGQVLPLSDVCRDVVQLNRIVRRNLFAPAAELPFFVIEMQLPVALANDAHRARAKDRIASANHGVVEIAGEVPEDRLPFQLAGAFE